MTALALARLQFAITTVYHFFFVPLTLGLSILVAIMETLYVRSGDAVYGLVGAVSVGMVGHSQAQHMFETQPMKMASAEALRETEAHAALSVFTIGNEAKREDVFAIKIPGMMSLLACNNLTCAIQGINNLQAEYEQTYGPGDYVPPVAVSYWAFRIMMAPSLLMIALSLAALFLMLKGLLGRFPWFLRPLLWAIPLPYLANTAGWRLAEVGRQPWIVFGLMLTQHAVFRS
jgi:cytochrome d ubiquinol oxidase subunit I